MLTVLILREARLLCYCNNAGDAAFPVNKGALCIKGWTAAATLAHPDRLTTPLEAWPESHRPGFALRQADVLQSYTA